MEKKVKKTQREKNLDLIWKKGHFEDDDPKRYQSNVNWLQSLSDEELQKKADEYR
jgi:hypothetical protein